MLYSYSQSWALNKLTKKSAILSTINPRDVPAGRGANICLEVQFNFSLKGEKQEQCNSIANIYVLLIIQFVFKKKGLKLQCLIHGFKIIYT